MCQQCYHRVHISIRFILVSYNSEKYLDCAPFIYIFPSRTRLAGLPEAVVYMSCSDSTGMDVYILLEKLLERNYEL